MRKPKQTQKVFTEEQFEKILLTIKRMPYTNTPLGEYNRLRDKTIIVLLNYCGLRPGECLKLRWEDIDFDQEMIYVVPYFNKERNDEPAVLTPMAKMSLLEYKEKVSKLYPLNDYIFPSILTGKPLNTDSFSKRFQRIVQVAGLSKFEYYDLNGRPRYSFHPYSCRHTFGTEAEDKVGLVATNKLMRHKNLTSTMRYIHSSFEKKRLAAKKLFT